MVIFHSYVCLPEGTGTGKVRKKDERAQTVRQRSLLSEAAENSLPRATCQGESTRALLCLIPFFGNNVPLVI